MSRRWEECVGKRRWEEGVLTSRWEAVGMRRQYDPWCRSELSPFFVWRGTSFIRE